MSAAEAYDSFMGRFSRPLSGQMADLASIRAGQRVLDVGCGTGALTGELVERLGPSGVAATDPSEPFVAATRARNPGVDVRRAPAERLPFGDKSFDAALAQLVVHFMRDPVAGLTEMGRVTRRDRCRRRVRLGPLSGSRVPSCCSGTPPVRWIPTSTTSLIDPARAKASWSSYSGLRGCALSRGRPCPCDLSMRHSRPGGSRSPAASALPVPTWRALTTTGARSCATAAGAECRRSRLRRPPWHGPRAALRRPSRRARVDRLGS